MNRVIWFAVAMAAAIESLSFMATNNKSNSNVLLTFILNPSKFLGMALFGIFCFLLLSQTLRGFFQFAHNDIKKRGLKNPTLFIEMALYVAGSLFLFLHSIWFTSILLILTAIDLFLSFYRREIE